MILKISSCRENHKSEWWVVDSIKRLHYRPLNEEEYNESMKGYTDLVIMDFSYYNDEIKYEPIMILCKLHNKCTGEEEDYSIITNSTVYLLNDNGKTIDCLG